MTTCGIITIDHETGDEVFTTNVGVCCLGSMRIRLPQGLTEEQIEQLVGVFKLYTLVAHPTHWQEQLTLTHSSLLRRLLRGEAPLPEPP